MWRSRLQEDEEHTYWFLPGVHKPIFRHLCPTTLLLCIRSTGHCFLIPCPGNRRSADVLLPLIQRNVLPGSIVHTDQWAAYNQLTFAATGYTHLTVNHSTNFVDPLSGCHTNTQEGMWHHVKRRMENHQKLENVFVDFMFRRRFEATSGVCQISRCFDAYMDVLKV